MKISQKFPFGLRVCSNVILQFIFCQRIFKKYSSIFRKVPVVGIECESIAFIQLKNSS